MRNTGAIFIEGFWQHFFKKTFYLQSSSSEEIPMSSEKLAVPMVFWYTLFTAIVLLTSQYGFALLFSILFLESSLQWLTPFLTFQNGWKMK